MKRFTKRMDGEYGIVTQDGFVSHFNEYYPALNRLAELEDKLESGELRDNNKKGCEMCKDDIFDAYVPVSYEGDICEKECAPGEEWVYHANYCPNCGRRLISIEAETRLKESLEEK